MRAKTSRTSTIHFHIRHRSAVPRSIYPDDVHVNYIQLLNLPAPKRVSYGSSLGRALKTKLALEAQPVGYEGLCCNPIENLMGLANPSTEDRGRRKKGEEIEVKSG